MTTPQPNRRRGPKASASKPPAPPSIETGHIGTFLMQTVPRLLDKDLIGGVPSSNNSNTYTADSSLLLHRQLETISDFMRHHHAETTLNKSAYYMPTIEAFASTQMDRQAAGLRTNTNRETAEGSAQVIQNHRQCLEDAIKDSAAINRTTTNAQQLPFPDRLDHLFQECLLPWHRRYFCPSDSQTGGYRTVAVRAGRTAFCPAQEVPREMNAVLAGLKGLHFRWLAQLSVSEGVSATYHSIALAAILLYSIVDVHPFADGNGRMARVCCNWILLQVLRLPFTVTLVATHLQRIEYIQAIRHGCASIQEIGITSSTSSASSSSPPPPPFEPLIRLLIGRISHAVQEVQRILAGKANAAVTEEEERIVRRVRERNAAGHCIICLEDHPNIATLCCGQAVHLNCLAEWLSTGSNCVNCRQELPRMTNRAPSVPEQPPVQPVNNNDLIQYINRVVQETYQDIRNARHGQPVDAENTTSIMNEEESSEEENSNDDDDDTVEYTTVPECAHCRNRAASDCANSMCGRCCVQNGNVYCTRHGQPVDAESTTTEIYDEESPEEDDATVSDEAESSGGDTTEEVLPACARCQNRAALDCANSMCGRCCLQNGNVYCTRHGQPVDAENTTTEMNEEEEEDIVTGTPYVPPPLACSGCYNRAAHDCRNAMCGGCCIQLGVCNCIRHNVHYKGYY